MHSVIYRGHNKYMYAVYTKEITVKLCFIAFAEKVDPCKLNPCRNGAACSPTHNNEYKCTCTQGYKGLHCEGTTLYRY